MSDTPLTIGIDARELLGEPTGVGRYLGELLRRWIVRPDAASRHFVLYTPEPLPFVAAAPAGSNLREVVAGSGRGTWWEQTHLRRAVRSAPPDVFFAGAYTAPLALGVPLAVTIHDVSFAAHPEWFRPREGARRRLLTRQAARAAEIVFTDSLFSRGEILERLGVPAERVKVIPPGVTLRSPTDAPREPLVLFAGTILNRRRLPATITAFAAATATRPEAQLVIAGADRSYPALDLAALAAAAGVGKRVEIRDYVPEPELDALYARASVFVFLSEYEGFGLTPLEALSAGVPIVVLDTPVAREVYGDAAWYVPRDADVRAATQAIRTLLEDEASRARLLASAPAVLARYSWDTAAAETLAGIEGAARP
ncbi:MAG TPA: glycosyltransferase family 1 protein [Vicinamibacterales bacterium]|nr:glycosyltransferase family 1 protein [Vicinamibacterales bacterium]